jgi:hypothetical protein
MQFNVGLGATVNHVCQRLQGHAPKTVQGH